MRNLVGKAVVITGAGSGLGATYALFIARQGGSVLVNDIDERAVGTVVEQIRIAGGHAAGCVADVADFGDAGRLIGACVREYGSIDGLVNNAGIEIIGPPQDLGGAAARRLVNVNLLGTINCGVQAIRQMILQQSGSIINVVSGGLMGLRLMSAYGASKGGILSATYCWAHDLAETPIRVNAISPQAPTGMAHQYLDYMGLTGEDKAEALAKFPAAETNAPAVAYLLSDRAAGVSGQVIRLDGPTISLIGPPAVLAETEVTVDDSADGFAAAFDKVLRPRLIPRGLLRLTGDCEFTVAKSTGSHD